MSDLNSSLPVRTENAGDVAVFLSDASTPSQKASVDANGSQSSIIKDASGNAVTSQASSGQRALDVGINVGGVQVDPRAIRALTATDVVTANQGTAAAVASAWPILITDGTHTAAVKAASTAAIATDPSLVVALSPNSPLPTGSNTIGSINAIISALPAGANIIGKVEITDGTNTQAVKAASTAALATDPSAVVALSPNSPLPTGSNAIGSVLANLQVASAPVSATNPVPVTITTSSPGIAIQDYHTSVNLAALASVTFTYTVVAAHTFNLERVWASATGKIKVVVQNNGSTIFAGFNSTAQPNVNITVISPPTIAAGNTVTVIITNDDKQQMDVYATIEGNQN